MVMTSSYEGFPMTLLEGMKMALPLVSFDVPTGPNEIIKDGINGFLIPPFNCNQCSHDNIYSDDSDLLSLNSWPYG